MDNEIQQARNGVCPSIHALILHKVISIMPTLMLSCAGSAEDGCYDYVSSKEAKITNSHCNHEDREKVLRAPDLVVSPRTIRGKTNSIAKTCLLDLNMGQADFQMVLSPQQRFRLLDKMFVQASLFVRVERFVLLRMTDDVTRNHAMLCILPAQFGSGSNLYREYNLALRILVPLVLMDNQLSIFILLSNWASTPFGGQLILRSRRPVIQ